MKAKASRLPFPFVNVRNETKPELTLSEPQDEPKLMSVSPPVPFGRDGNPTSTLA